MSITGISTVWSISRAVAVVAVLLASAPLRGADAGVCPIRKGQPLRYVDVFDGPVKDMAMLVPDEAGERSRYWKLGYVYDAGRVVVVGCKYAIRRRRTSRSLSACPAAITGLMRRKRYESGVNKV